jgi:hypothetical protein
MGSALAGWWVCADAVREQRARQQIVDRMDFISDFLLGI